MLLVQRVQMVQHFVQVVLIQLAPLDLLQELAIMLFVLIIVQVLFQFIVAINGSLKYGRLHR
jgi:hypothetical protein